MSLSKEFNSWEGGKTKLHRVPVFTSDRDERVKIRVNSGITKVDRQRWEAAKRKKSQTGYSR